MSYKYKSRTPTKGCFYCSTTENVKLCTNCQAVPRCKKHRKLHRRDREGIKCMSIDLKRSMRHLQWIQLIQMLDRKYDPLDVPWNHHIASTHEHIEYRKAVYNHALSLQPVATQESLEQQAKNLAICRKFEPWRGDFLLPAVLIRLNRDREAWASLRHMITYSLYTQRGEHGMEPFAYLSQTNPFDRPDYLFRCHGCQYNVLATLIKIRMIRDIESAVEAHAAIGGNLPRELVAMVLSHVPVSDIIRGDPDLAYLDHEPMVVRLRRHVMWLFLRVSDECRDMWYFIFHGKLPRRRRCICKPGKMFLGDICVWDREMKRNALRDPWIDSPGAMDYLEYLMGIAW